MELQESFVEYPIHVVGLMHLLTSQCCICDLEAALLEDLVQAVNFYKQDLLNAVMFPSEYCMWVRKWELYVYDVPEKLGDALQACDQSSFSNIWVLLQHSLTIPMYYFL